MNKLLTPSVGLVVLATALTLQCSRPNDREPDSSSTSSLTLTEYCSESETEDETGEEGGPNVAPAAGGVQLRGVKPPPKPCRCKNTTAEVLESPTELCGEHTSPGPCTGETTKIKIKCSCNSLCKDPFVFATYDFGGCGFDAAKNPKCQSKGAVNGVDPIDAPLLGAALAATACAGKCKSK